MTADNAQTYENYLTNYPTSNYRIDVKQRLDSIYDQNAWLVACRTETSKGYQQFWIPEAFPALMMGMPYSSGEIKVYVTKVDNDYYAMHLSAKLDTWMSGPSSPAIRLAAYTLHLPGDPREKVGFRLFKAVVLAMDMEDLEEIPTKYEMDSPNWEDEWSPSVRCLEVMRWVRGGVVSDRQSTQVVLVFQIYFLH